jgi:zinc protease
VLGVGGGYEQALVARLEAALRELPSGSAAEPPVIEVAEIGGRAVEIIAKPQADASLSLGFPIDVHRGERDFYALWIANSWLGEHRNQSGRLFQVIRETRGLNYGDYSYIEAFPEGGDRTMPPVNVARRHQLFEIWIRTLPNDQALFALRAALRELERLIEDGMTSQDFELRREFLKKYVLHFASTTEERLGYALDDRFYGIESEGHLERFRRMMQELTLEEVNAAIKRHLQLADLKIAIVTGDPEGLRAAIESDRPSPIEYPSPPLEAIRAEDEEIASWPLSVPAASMSVVPVETMFETGTRGASR